MKVDVIPDRDHGREAAVIDRITTWIGKTFPKQ
jgi:hypothetical protein